MQFFLKTTMKNSFYLWLDRVFRHGLAIFKLIVQKFNYAKIILEHFQINHNL
jgi:hypothetical protein